MVTLGLPTLQAFTKTWQFTTTKKFVQNTIPFKITNSVWSYRQPLGYLTRNSIDMTTFSLSTTIVLYLKTILKMITSMLHTSMWVHWRIFILSPDFILFPGLQTQKRVHCCPRTKIKHESGFLANGFANQDRSDCDADIVCWEQQTQMFWIFPQP